MRQLNITLRHFAESDVPIRCALLRDAGYQANLNHLAVLADDQALHRQELDVIRNQQETRRVFTVCTRDGTVIGFTWLSPIDWRNQCCELSFAILPEYRYGLGILAIAAVRDYLHRELNMQIVVNQVLSHNTMLHSTDSLAAHRQVACEFDSHTVGEWRTACYWTNNERELSEQYERMRRERSARIRAAVSGRAP